MLPYFTIYNITFFTYNIAILAGLLIVVAGSVLVAPKFNLKRIHIFKMGIICIFFYVLGSKVIYFLFDGIRYLKEYLADTGNGSPFPFKEMFDGWRLMGGVAFFLAGGWIYTKIAGLEYFRYISGFAVFAALGISVGRMGCFFNGCCYGTEYHGIFAVQFPHTGPVYPLQLYESAGFLIAFLVLLILMLKKVKYQYIACLCVILICAIRSATEYLRPDAKWLLPWLSVTQVLAIAVVLFIILITAISIKKERKSTP